MSQNDHAGRGSPCCLLTMMWRCSLQLIRGMSDLPHVCCLLNLAQLVVPDLTAGGKGNNDHTSQGHMCTVTSGSCFVLLRTRPGDQAVWQQAARAAAFSMQGGAVTQQSYMFVESLTC